MLQDAKINTNALKKINQVIKQNNKTTQIIAVTKTLSIKAVQSALENNIKIIGENRVVEAEKKFLQYQHRRKIQLHLIGHLQSNKAKKAVNIFDIIETADSEKIIHHINRHAKKIHKKQQILIQVNIGTDQNKFGFLKHQLEEALINIKQHENIEIKGLMTILPQNISIKKTTKLYLELKAIQEQVQQNHFKQCQLTSMGMSNDFEQAILAGSTHIRIGTFLYGRRQQH